jgi:undecaprenyl-diphosphatase
MSFDEWLLVVIRNYTPTQLEIICIWLSDRVTFSFPLLLLLCYQLWRYFGKKTWYSISWLGLTIAVGDGAGQLFKYLLAQPRPCFSLAHYSWVEPCGAALTGMPSNHALNFFAVATFITVITPWRNWHIALFCIAISVAFSRIYLIKHFPSQVLVGIILGLIIGWTMGFLSQRIKSRL